MRTKPYILIYITHLPSQGLQICLCPNEWCSNPDTLVKHTVHHVVKQTNTTKKIQIIMDIGAIWRNFMQERTVAKRRKEIALNMAGNVQILYSASCWFEQNDSMKGSACMARHLIKWLDTDCDTQNRTVGIPFSITFVTSVPDSQGDGSEKLTNYVYNSLALKLRICGLVRYALFTFFIVWGLGKELTVLLLICIYNNEHGDR